MSHYRLLIIEDEKKTADLAFRIASEADFDVRATQDCHDILSLYDEFMPHVIILDLMMPEMDGFEMLNLLHERNSPARIIVLSSEQLYRRMATHMGEGLKLSVAATVSKPFRPTILRQILEVVKYDLTQLKIDGFSAGAVA